MTAISAPREPIKSALQDNEVRKLFSRFFELLTRRARTLVPNAFDRDVFLFIADRTLPFGKLSKDIPDRWFLDGVTGKGNSRGHRAGLSMKRSQLYKSRKALRDQGLVRDQKVGRCKRYAVALEPVWAILTAEERELFAPLLNLSDPDWQAEKVHSVDVQQVHSVDLHTEKRCPFRTRAEEKKSSAPIVAPDADRMASPSSTEEKRAHAHVETHPAAAPAITSPSAPIQVVPAAAPASRVAKRGRPPKELWGSTLADRFDTAFREAWPEAELPPEHSIKLKKQWEHVATHWRRTDIGPGEWIEWCVKNWRTTFETVFKHVELRQKRDAAWRAEAPGLRNRQWQKDVAYPEFPDLGFLFVYRKAFEREYDRRDSQMIRCGLLLGDKILRQLILKGWPLEDAQREVDARMAKRKFVEDLDERARKLNEGYRRLEREQQDPAYRRAIARVRSEMYQEANPVKPVSPAGYPKPSFSNGAGAVKRLPPRPVWKDEIEPLPPLPPLAEWKDELEEVSLQASDLPTTHAVAA